MKKKRYNQHEYDAGYGLITYSFYFKRSIKLNKIEKNKSGIVEINSITTVIMEKTNHFGLAS